MTTHSAGPYTAGGSIYKNMNGSLSMGGKDIAHFWDYKSAVLVANVLNAAPKISEQLNKLERAMVAEQMRLCKYCRDGREPFEYEGGYWHDVARGHADHRIFHPLHTDCNTEPCKANIIHSVKARSKAGEA